MNDFVIYTDSACDIPPELLKEWGVPYSWLTYVFEGDARQYSNYELPFPEFYDKMRKGSVARTSAVNADAFVQGFEPILQDGKDILHQDTRKDGVLTITVEADFAALTGALGGIQTLKAQGVDTIVFVTNGASSTFALADVLSQGSTGDTYTLTHDGSTVTFTLGAGKTDASAILIH